MSSIDTGYAAAPLDDDCKDEVLPMRRRRLPLLTALLAASLVAAAAFVVGVEVQKHYGVSSSSSAGGVAGGTGAAAAFAGRQRAGGGTGGGAAGRAGGFLGGGAGGAGGATIGLITLIRGSTLYVTDFSGNTVKVKASAGLRVTKTVTAALKSLHPGDSVVVRGTKQKDGSYKASSITLGSLAGGNG